MFKIFTAHTIGLIVAMLSAVILFAPSSSFAGEPMTEVEYIAKFVENTSVGKWEGSPYWEYLKPGGTLKGLYKGDRYDGYWCFGSTERKRGNCERDSSADTVYTTFCVNYAGYTDDDGCRQVVEKKDGDGKYSYDYYEGDDVKFTETIAPGNIKDL